MQDGRPIVSKTDLKGTITYVNPYFVEVSGFTASELIGAPHNIVRHPDMPAEAFADLWKTLKLGELWSALVKNRRKNGDFYWVVANVTPIMENGRVIGFMSVRTKPTRQQIDDAQRAYAEISQGEKSSLVLDKGKLYSNTALARLRAWSTPSLTTRLSLMFGLQSLILAGLALFTLLSLSSNENHAGVALSYFAVLSIGAHLWWYLRHHVSRPLLEATWLARSLAGGDLSEKTIPVMHGELGGLLKALQQLNVNLVAAIGDIRDNVDAINDATAQIADGNMDLSSRTEMQASSLEETASSMEEFSSTVRLNASHAQDADALVGDANVLAQKGSAAIASVGKTMDDISASANRVADIVGVIDGIAFQTNILALNAAVEAAHAGESGRGFAVVASEVRNLSQRSAVAAKEIRELIGQSVVQVGVGAKLVEDASSTINDVATGVTRVKAIVADIAAASREQADGILQVNRAVVQLDETTQQNAALVEQAAAAAGSLHEQALHLSRAVSVLNMQPASTEFASMRSGSHLPARVQPALTLSA